MPSSSIIKKPGKAFERAGDKWYKKTKKNFRLPKKKSERIRGTLRVIAPMTVAAGAGAYSGASSGMEEVKERTHAAGQIAPPASIIIDIKKVRKKVKKKWMPFQSEKQRRYLWANEPEIARDWTDTYGSRIRKDNGGIMGWADQGGMKNYLGEQPMVNAPQFWRSGPDSAPIRTGIYY